MSLSKRDLVACRGLLRGGSRSFYAASFLLPRRVRDSATALYAFCRVADDAADSQGGETATLEQMWQRLDDAYAGRPWRSPVDRAFAAVVERYAIPRALPEALFEGFAWDDEGRRYQDLPALQDYAARVAGTVGAMMTLLMGRREPEVLARACDLGVAMQLTNIARDVGEDAAAGRLYLPMDWMAEAGIDTEAWLARPRFDADVGAVVERLLAAAGELYERADMGIAGLPAACRPGIAAARVLYAGIGHEVARLGHDSVSQRARVPAGRKARLLGQALAMGVLTRPVEDLPPLESNRFLVDAVRLAGAPSLSPAHGSPWWDLAGRAIWVLELCERLEQREQSLRSERA